MKLSTRWTKYARKPEQAKELYAKVLAARPALEYLRRLIEDEMKTKVKMSKSKDAYQSDSWPYLQADAIGEERAYLSVIKLLTINYEEQ